MIWRKISIACEAYTDISRKHYMFFVVVKLYVRIFSKRASQTQLGIQMGRAARCALRLYGESSTCGLG